MGKSKKRTHSRSTSPSQVAQVSSSASSVREHSHKKKRKKHSSEHHQRMIELFGEDSSASSDSLTKKRKHSKKHKKEKKHKKSKEEERRKKSKSYGESSKECHAEAGPSNLQEDRLMADRAKAMADRAKAMAPMTKEEWDKRQSVIRKVYDEETGRSSQAPVVRTIKKFLECYTEVSKNTAQLQSGTTKFCGHYVCVYSFLRCSGYTHKEFLRLFSAKNLCCNDKYIARLLTSIFGLCVSCKISMVVVVLKDIHNRGFVSYNISDTVVWIISVQYSIAVTFEPFVTIKQDNTFYWNYKQEVLIKGDGEVVEEIVSREQHREINQMATKKDGEHFQSVLAEKVKK